jgi:hypothetical protein
MMLQLLLRQQQQQRWLMQHAQQPQ